VRASFLLIVAIALLLGLGVAVLVKVSGLLTPAPVVVQTPPPAPETPSVLVAAHNMYPGDTIRAGDVRLRHLRAEELAHYEANKTRYLPPVLDSAYYRFLNKNLEADRPLLKDDLEPMAKPEPLSQRLLPGTRAIDVSISKENSAGGLIGVGDWVDVYLTTEVGRTDSDRRSLRTALMAQRVPVVAKRDTLWPLYAPLPPNQPIQYTLGVNPYRAALLDFARTHGTLSILPVSQAEKTRLDDYRKSLKDTSSGSVAHPFEPGNQESQDEEKRILAYNRGELTVGNEDLVRLFGLTPLHPPTPPLTVEMYHGVNKRGTMQFNSLNGSGVYTAGPTPQPAPHYEFLMPPSAETRPSTPATRPSPSGPVARQPRPQTR
jgi:Flp pilus assembly protein CpaB